MKRAAALTLGALAAGATLAGIRLIDGPERAASTAGEAVVRNAPKPDAPGVAPVADPAACETDDDLVAPTGRPAGLSCRTARAVTKEVRARFATDVKRPSSGLFADLLVSWIDPHGLWSDAADAPTARGVEVRASALLDELEAQPDGDEPCPASLALGGELVDWIAALRENLDRARREAPAVSRAEAGTLLLVSPYQQDAVTPARTLAVELGRTLGSVEKSFGTVLEPFVTLSRERFLPELDRTGWQGVVLASAVRAYVAAIDPHGQWTPIDEEWALYADDESFEDTERLWGEMLRTALGARVVDLPTPPLEVDDLVLAVNGTGVAGMSIEQLGQLERAAPAGNGERTVLVVRAAEDSPRTVVIPAPVEDAPALPDPRARGEVDLELVQYGNGEIALVTVRYVGDDLGERLEGLFAELARQSERPVGVLLDLRGNGGGSTDGAADALGVFLQGLPVFPLLHAGRVTEVLVTPEPPASHRFDGPVAALVDRRTASAAEMLAGALDRYGRGVLLGAPTFGKGSVQEYFRDHTGQGVLRLTTHLFVLPDGSPVQGRGLTPEVTLEVERNGERETDMEGFLESVSGPDVRRPTRDFPGWPRLTGRLGPCPDAVICAALRRLSGRRLTPAARAAVAPKRRIPR